jgi:hypothetical protein
MSQPYFPSDMYEVFNKDDISKTPILDISDRMGSTGYIDFIGSDYFKGKNSAVLKGVDHCRRPFLTFCYTLCPDESVEDDEDVTEEDEETKGKREAYLLRPSVVTLFQRYSSEEECWITGGKDPEGLYSQGGLHFTLSTDTKRNYLELLSELVSANVDPTRHDQKFTYTRERWCSKTKGYVKVNTSIKLHFVS